MKPFRFFLGSALFVALLASGTSAASLSGFVRKADSTDVAIANATVRLFQFGMGADSLFYQTTSLADGSYSLADVEAGSYTATCKAEGYEQSTTEVVVDGDNQLDFLLERLPGTPGNGTLSGRVVYDDSGDPLPNAVIQLIGQNGAGTVRVRTNAQGDYSAQASEGDYIVACFPFGSAGRDSLSYYEYYDDTQSLTKATIVSVEAGQAVEHIDFGIPELEPVAAVTISGKVTDENGNPLAYASVMFWVNGVLDSLTAARITNEQGEYSLTIQYGLHPGTNQFVAMANKSGYRTEFYREKSAYHLADPIVAESDTSIADIDFTLAEQIIPSTFIRGTVTDDDGAPLANVSVLGTDLQSNRTYFARTRPSGKYELNVVNTGHYIVSFDKYGYAPEYYDDAPGIDAATPLWVEDALDGIDAELTYTGVDSGGTLLTGTVSNDSLKPVAGVLVTARDAQGMVHGYDYTNEQGEFAIAGLSARDYSVHASKANYTSGLQPILIEDDNVPTAVVNFTIGSMVTGIAGNETPTPETHVLLRNYPNPFNPSTTIAFDLPNAQTVRIAVFNLVGQEVRELFHGPKAAGPHNVVWNGTDSAGHQVVSGVYLYAIETDEGRVVNKMLLVK